MPELERLLHWQLTQINSRGPAWTSLSSLGSLWWSLVLSFLSPLYKACTCCHWLARIKPGMRQRWWQGEDKDKPRLSAIIALSFIFTSPGGMWGALHPRELKWGGGNHSYEAGGGFKVLHLLKVGYQTSQGEILARHKIRKIWWYDFPSCFYADIKKILENPHNNENAEMKSSDWNLLVSPMHEH